MPRAATVIPHLPQDELGHRPRLPPARLPGVATGRASLESGRRAGGEPHLHRPGRTGGDPDDPLPDIAGGAAYRQRPHPLPLVAA